MKNSPCNNVGGVRVVHFVVCSTFCLQNGFLQPTKWYGHKLDYKIAFSSLQNGMATNPTLQSGVPCQLSWTFFLHNDSDIFIQEWSNICIHAPKQLQGHFVELPPCPELSSKGNFSIAIL